MPRNPATWEGIDLCDGRYCSLKKLGEGGMGYVYKARDKRMGRFVVIKVPRAEMLVDSQFRKRFVRELQSLVKLEHRHIVAIQDYNQEDKIPYAVMQYLPQGDLDDRRSQDPQDLKKWLKDIASALDFVHKKGYVHRDVKPGNILFDDEGYAYLSDFGIAKVVADSEENQQGLTQMGFAIGTPDYMAPELHSNQFDGRIDQYALAVTVYELLSGGTPYRGTTPVEIMFAHKTEQAARIPNISAEFNDAILKGMAKDPDQRYASCAKFAKAVLVAMDNKAQAAPAPQQTERTAAPAIETDVRSKTMAESSRRSKKARAAKEWFIKIGGQQTGPFSSQQLKSLTDEGQINETNLVSPGKDGQSTDSWIKAGTIKGLFTHSESSTDSQAEMNTGVQIKINTTGGQAHTVRKSVAFSDVLTVGFSLTCCFPIGLIILWTRPWTTALKLGITASLFIIALLLNLLSKV